MGRHKGMSTPMQLVVAVAAVVVIGGSLGLAFGFVELPQASVSDDGGDADDGGQDVSTAPWSGLKIKVNLEGANLSGATLDTGTLHIYEEKPTNWDDDQAIQQVYSEDDRTISVDSDGTTTFQDYPGTYYIVAEVANDYPEMFTVEIPDGSDRFGEIYDSPDKYNNNPKTVDFTMHDIYSLGSQNWDLGISTNTTDNKDYDDSNTYGMSDNTEYRLDYAVIETGDVDPTTDSNTDGVYDEGLTQSYIEVRGASNKDGATKKVYWDTDLGIDEFGAESKTTIQFGTSDSDFLTFNDEYDMVVEVGVTATESEDGSNAADGDEKASDGENFWDVTFFDSAGNSNSVGDVLG